MIRKFVLLALLACTTGCADAPVAEPPERVRAEAPAELIQKKPRPVPHTHTCYGGVVVALGADWVEIGAGWSGPRSREMEPDFDNSKPVRLSTAGTRPGGDTGEPERGGSRTHLLSDLKIGDRVHVEAGTTREGEQFCITIIIERRPGGRIPPQFGDPWKQEPYAFHLSDQAYQDWEEKGVPIPAKYLDPDGRAPWTNPPYPPVAPMPRPANAKP
jgi:hypothetical protein